MNSEVVAQKLARLRAVWGRHAVGQPSPLLVIMDFDRTITTADRCVRRIFGAVFLARIVWMFMRCSFTSHGVLEMAPEFKMKQQEVERLVSSHVTRHMSHVTRHTSHVTRHTSHVTRHTSHVTRHTSHVTHHQQHPTHPVSQITRHYLPLERDPLIPSAQREVCQCVHVSVSRDLTLHHALSRAIAPRFS